MSTLLNTEECPPVNALIWEAKPYTEKEMQSLCGNESYWDKNANKCVLDVNCTQNLCKDLDSLFKDKDEVFETCPIISILGGETKQSLSDLCSAGLDFDKNLGKCIISPSIDPSNSNILTSGGDGAAG